MATAFSRQAVTVVSRGKMHLCSFHGGTCLLLRVGAVAKFLPLDFAAKPDPLAPIPELNAVPTEPSIAMATTLVRPDGRSQPGQTERQRSGVPIYPSNRSAKAGNKGTKASNIRNSLTIPSGLKEFWYPATFTKVPLPSCGCPDRGCVGKRPGSWICFCRLLLQVRGRRTQFHGVPEGSFSSFVLCKVYHLVNKCVLHQHKKDCCSLNMICKTRVG